MIARILIIIAIPFFVACSIRTDPPNTVRLPSSEKASVIDEIVGSYCYCSSDKNQLLQTDYAVDNATFAGIELDQLNSASIINVQKVGDPLEGVSIHVSTNNAITDDAVFNRESGGCFVDKRKVRCNRLIYGGAALGVGWYQATTDFNIDQKGALHITEFYRECGLGLLIIPFCETFRDSLKLSARADDGSCQCE